MRRSIMVFIKSSVSLSLAYWVLRIGSCVLGLASYAYATQETLVLETYYPSPYGVYNELRLYPRNPPPACSAEGVMFYDGDKGMLMVCSGNPLGPWPATGVSGFTNFEVFDTPGTYTWTVPAGVTKIMVEVWGGGGGGNYNPHINLGGYTKSGGGGGYGKGIFTITSGSYMVIVGSGGRGASPPLGNGKDGGTSSFGSLISATGGGGGTYVYGGGGPGNGGSSNAYINIRGKRGGENVWAGGGSAGGGGEGGAVPLVEPPQQYMNGIAPGGGGSGANEGYNAAGGDGASGRVIVWW